jgi:hypothetical protein
MGSQKVTKEEDKFTHYLAPNLPYPTYYFLFRTIDEMKNKTQPINKS